MTKAADTRRIRRRAKLWRSWVVSPEDAERQLALFEKESGRARDLFLAETLDLNILGLCRALRQRQRETCAHMRPYWREQAMRWLAAVRALKALMAAG